MRLTTDPGSPLGKGKRKSGKCWFNLTVLRDLALAAIFCSKSWAEWEPVLSALSRCPTSISLNAQQPGQVGDMRTLESS